MMESKSKIKKPKLNKAQKINEKIKKLYAELKVVQETECKHDNPILKFDANTGNYDPSSDCYWVNVNCPDCLKVWTVYSEDKEEYHKYSMMKYSMKRKDDGKYQK